MAESNDEGKKAIGKAQRGEVKSITMNIPFDGSLHLRLKTTAAMLDVTMTRLVAAVLDMALPEWLPDGTGISFDNPSHLEAVKLHLKYTEDGE